MRSTKRLSILLSLLCAAALLALLASCDHPTGASKPATRDLHLMDAGGANVLATLKLEMGPKAPAETIGGDVRIVSTAPDFKLGDAVGATFQAKCMGDAFDADLNPGAKDHNIMLSGKVEGDLISGIWYQIDGKASLPKGRFEIRIPGK